MQLLRDMQVVTVREQSGVYVRSAENAKRYLQMVGEKNELRQKKQRLRALLAQQEAVARQVSELCGSILDDSVQPEQAAEQLKTFSCRVPQDWPDAGKTLGSLHFWQATGATVVAIARADALTVSPGPYAGLRSEDRILFVGDQEAREAVARFFSKTETT
ncbi:MAG: cation:proton antiporter regulatory subunit [Acutalibacteraceae bacterium]